MGFDRVGIVQNGCHATLRPVGRAIGQLAFTQYCDAQMGRQGEGECQASGAAADDQNIVLLVLAHVRVPRESEP